MSPPGAVAPTLVGLILLTLFACAPSAVSTPGQGRSPASGALDDSPRLDIALAVPAPSPSDPEDDTEEVAEQAPEPPGAQPDGACPVGMVLVDGMFCPNVKQVCLRWVDPITSPYAFTRCAEWKRPATCEGERVHMRYCIDRDELVRPPDALPLVNVSWDEAEAVCEGRGEAICTEAEWEFACEGEQMLPYPYGYERDPTACNFDRTDLGKMGEGLNDHRAEPESFPRCVSPFGVYDMVGNVDEWSRRVYMPAPFRSALHGGWWLPGRNNCRQATLEHAESYAGKQVGVRCCRRAGQRD